MIPLVCSYEDYLERKTIEICEARKAVQRFDQQVRSPIQKEAQSQLPARTVASQKRSWDREREKLEAEITQLEKKQAQLFEILADGKIYQDRSQSMQFVEEQKQVQEQLFQKLKRWEELCLLLGV